MAWFGRETEQDRQRVERFGAWVRRQSPYALVSFGAGMLSIVDCWTLVIGVAAGIAAIATGGIGLREVNANADLGGRRFAMAGITCGIVGLALSVLMWTVVYPWLASP